MQISEMRSFRPGFNQRHKHKHNDIRKLSRYFMVG